MRRLHGYESEADLSSAAITDRPAAELVDPDEDLELREDFSAELQKSLGAVARGVTTNSAEQVGRRLGLSW
jgi:hypothetical protein